MTNADWWATADTTPAGDNRPGAESQQIKRLHLLWTLKYGTHVCTAEVWGLQPDAAVPTSAWAYDLRYTIDGELRETELYRGVDGGTKATLMALAKKDAIYARKSTDQSGVSDDQRSVARQVESARVRRPQRLARRQRARLHR